MVKIIIFCADGIWNAPNVSPDSTLTNLKTDAPDNGIGESEKGNPKGTDVYKLFDWL